MSCSPAAKPMPCFVVFNNLGFAIPVRPMMTASFRTAVEVPPAHGADATDAAPQRAAAPLWTDATVFPALIVFLLILYSLLQNPYWVPAGDSELYTAAARNIAIGQGYTFNGQPVAIIPPGWSLMMAAVMKLSPYVLPLKLLTMTCMIGALAIGYWIVRRFVSPAKAVGIILLTAVISHVYQATYWLISESAFCLVSSASLLVAMQIAEGRRQGWRIVLLVLLCFGAIAIRWAGVLGAVLVVAALLDGQWRPRRSTPWVVSALIAIVTFVTFFGLRYGLRGTPEESAAARDMVTGTGEDVGTAPLPDNAPPITGAANQSAKAYQLFPTGSYADRFLNWGRWFSFLYWQPFRAAASSRAILITASISGWILIGVLAVLTVRSLPRLRWLWPALFVYTGVLALGWTNVNARYYVPIGFLLTLGIFLATDELAALLSRRPRWRKTLIGAFVAFLASVALCNVALYSVEMVIARSDRFYARYEDGLNMSLISACQYLNTLPDPPRDGEIAVSQRYTNLNKPRASPFGLRATVLLISREVVTPRFTDTSAPPNSNARAGRSLRRWLKSKGVKWYLYQPDISPWRVWHFRLGWYEKWQTGQTADKDTAGWQLYRATANGDDWIPVKLPNKMTPVTRVPGL